MRECWEEKLGKWVQSWLDERLIVTLVVGALGCVVAVIAWPSSQSNGASRQKTKVEERNEQRRLFVENNPEVVVKGIEVIGDFQYVVVESAGHSRARLKYDFDGYDHFLPESQEVQILAVGDKCTPILYDVYRGGVDTKRKGVGLRRIREAEKEQG